jgi:hypothetical protein
MEEIWKDIKGYEGRYQVSNMGRVKSLPKEWLTHNNAIRKHNGIILKQFKTGRKNNQYNTVSLPKRYRKVHQLVAENFIPNPLNKPQINHINGNKDDNSVNNLEWCTCIDNIRHAWDNNLNYALRGSTNGMAKITEDDVITIITEHKKGHITMTSLAKKYGLTLTNVSYIIKRKTWKHVKI